MQDRWAEWLVGQSGLDELDPEFAASLETSLSWGIGLGLDAAGTAYEVGSAVYTVGEAIVQSYIDTAVGYYNAGGGGVDGVLLAISGVSGVAGLAEGWYGYDIATGEQLSGLGRAGKFLDGGLAVFGVAGTTAKAVSMAGKGIAGARVGLGRLLGEGADLAQDIRKASNTGCFVPGTLVSVSALPVDFLSDPACAGSGAEVDSPMSGEAGERAASSLAVLSRPPRVQVPIEHVPLGARVPTKNPRPAEFDDSLPEPDQNSWLRVRLVCERDNGSTVDWDLLRPLDWIERHQLAPGRRVRVDIEELELHGTAVVDQIESCPPIAEGDGSVVIGRFVTRQVDRIVRVTLPGGVVIEGTPIHPVWSADREEWVKLTELRTGEHLLGDDGPIPVLETDMLNQSVPVYNLEVHGEHVYQIAELGILVHNAPCTNDLVTTISRPDGSLIEVDTVSLFKATRPGVGQEIRSYGFTIHSHPDGAFFAKEIDLAFEYFGNYSDDLLEVRVPRSVYDRLLRQHESPYPSDPSKIEVIIPPDLYDVINSSSFIWHT